MRHGLQASRYNISVVALSFVMIISGDSMGWYWYVSNLIRPRHPQVLIRLSLSTTGIISNAGQRVCG